MTRDGMVYRKGRWRYYLDGKWVSKRHYEKRYPPAVEEDGPCSLSAVPVMKSDAAGVHPRDRHKAMEHAKKIGVPTDFDEEGRAIFTSRDHQRRYCREIGMVNNDDNWSAKDFGVRPKSDEEIVGEFFGG